MNSARTLQVSAQAEREIVMTRSFDAPREMVFDALTKPELLKRWLHGPDGWMLETCEVDLRVGGQIRYVWRKHTGAEMGMRGTFREIDAPRRIVSTELFDEDWTQGEVISTQELAEESGVTTLTNTLHYSSREARDNVLKSGMERGVAASYDRLARIVLPSRLAVP
ncbi:MAG TPA: SRPBCC family protein [Bryobacteraceae bacterium]|jgi:uncharacterized protein YndB with AHSA1/START domain|nr:SRPBCC family protein [Bryobacteraceae bacterium]